MTSEVLRQTTLNVSKFSINFEKIYALNFLFEIFPYPLHRWLFKNCPVINVYISFYPSAQNLDCSIIIIDEV